MKIQKRLLLTSLCLMVVCFLPGCAAIMQTGVEFGQHEMRARDYRDQGFSRKAAYENASYDQMWEERQ